MSSRGTPSRFLASVLRNGLGRYVPQLKRISIIFSKNAQSSLGVRDFIEEGVVDYAKNNPGTVVYVSPQTCRIPKVVAEYLNGNVREELVISKSSPQISELLTKLANQSGLEIMRIRKPFHTDNPSIQGQWHPFTNRPPAIGPIRPQQQDSV
ncbi:39S ribosomal protein L43, mitochondrial [Hippoglossus hippoglossus]|uniref:39S ribosomal protein L43, mitochondrial n=1 Tax=Hippoglossus hippoglossus TaxID=8267 RepID=UPI00148DB7C0|nr:39S ribosomal protein L43, mitochondrial [Hippoglossus hippoglossus]